MRLFLLIVGLLWYTCAATQSVFQHEIAVITENDNYDLGFTDRYYSNGFVFQYNGAATRSRGTHRLLHHVELAHKVYNPYKNNQSVEQVLQEMDRPYAGWLSASYHQSRLSFKHHVLRYGVTAGVMGPTALGSQVQNGWHRLIGLYRVLGWEYQLRNEAGLNVAVDYYHSLVAAAPERQLTLHVVAKAMLGNTFTNAAAGLLLKTGNIHPDAWSGFWNGNLGGKPEHPGKKEFIFFVEPLLVWQGYNATVQGGLFNRNKGPYTTGVAPLVLQARTGLVYTGNRIGFRWYYTFRTREGNLMKAGEQWGTIGLSVRF